MAVILPPVYELVVKRFEDIQLFFTHCLTQLVGFAFGESCKFLGQEHDLFLIDRDTVCVLEEFLHFRKVVFDLFRTLFPGNE